MLIRITSNYFIAGYDVQTGNIAPIIKYMNGWNYNKILNYCNSKKWHLEIIMPTLDLANPKIRDDLADQIKLDIDDFCSTFYESGHRNHLGASEVGNECWRELWYNFRWVKTAVFDGRMLRLFNVGHQAEPRFITYLRGIGFEVKEFNNPILNHHPESDSYWYSEIFEPSSDGMSNDVTDTFHEQIATSRGMKRNQFRISGAKGHYGGSLDGMAKAPSHYNLETDLVFLTEYKTNNTGSGYDKVAKLDLGKSKPKHFAQMCQYGAKYKLKYGLYMIENKNDSDITIKIVELDWNYGEQLARKAEEIIFSKEPPPRISENPAFYNCKFCEKAGICHGGEVPEKNCRSCRNVEPVDDAQWHCHHYKQNIPSEFIKQGCNDWIAV